MSEVVESFEKLPLPHTAWPMATLGWYRIYSTAQDYTLVEAGSVLDALDRCGVADVLKVEREESYKYTLLKRQKKQAEEPNPTVFDKVR